MVVTFSGHLFGAAGLTDFLEIVGDCGFERIGGKDGTVHLNRRQSPQLARYVLLGQLERLVDCFSFDEFGCDGTGGNGCSASESLELNL